MGAEVQAPEPQERFELREELGAGSMGTVYRVFDRMRGHDVALKALKHLGPAALYRFKREFRELAELSHPNLVALHELYRVDGEWMYTMELVEGVSFRQWIDRDPGRLRPALIQLADALTAVHAAGKVHRDVKPSNVLVDRGGHVVLCDFGLVGDLDPEDQTRDGAAVGTPAYMSPEQAALVPVTSATDWYAVGTMLYEALTGKRPFAGSGPEIMLEKQRADPPRPRSLARSVPEDLDALVVRLLDRDPGRRPDGLAVLAALGAEPSPWTRRIIDRAHRPEGAARRAEIGLLHRALNDSREHPVMVLVSGPHGVGRTALLDGFATEARMRGALVFEVRVGRREAVPMQGFDQLIDRVTRHLLGLPKEEVDAIVPPEFGELARMFPVLRRVRSTPDLPGGPAQREMVPEKVLGVAVELFRKLAARQPLAVVVDDLHWGAAVEAFSTMTMLDAEPPLPLLFVGSYAAEHADGPVVKPLRQWRGDRREIALTP